LIKKFKTDLENDRQEKFGTYQTLSELLEDFYKNHLFSKDSYVRECCFLYFESIIGPIEIKNFFFNQRKINNIPEVRLFGGISLINSIYKIIN
jgi:hypothetical protein